MSSSRICARLACTATARGKAMLKWGTVGALSGAAVGAFSGWGALAHLVGGNAADAAYDAVLRHDAPSYGCTYIVGTPSEYGQINRLDCDSRKQENALREKAWEAGNKASDAAIADKQTIVMLLSTAIGAGLGLFGGVMYGWKKPLPEINPEVNLQPDAEMADNNYNRLNPA